MSTPRTSRPSHLASSPFNKSRDEQAAKHPPVAVGDRVSHDRWGLGRAVKADGPHAVIVDFGGQLRRVAFDSPRLERL